MLLHSAALGEISQLDRPWQDPPSDEPVNPNISKKIMTQNHIIIFLNCSPSGNQSQSAGKIGYIIKSLDKLVNSNFFRDNIRLNQINDILMMINN